jgi:predicted DNA-binding protein
VRKSVAIKASITLPAELEAELKQLAGKEGRTLSGLLQEASRYYLNLKKLESIQHKMALRAKATGMVDEDDVDRLIHELRR